MPRDGSEVYYIPPGTEGLPDTTIESIKYNDFIHDVEQDLNHPRPIIAGGTGASSAEEALFALSGEMTYQIVTNFDTHPYIPGSFYSGTAATAPPVAGHAFAGIIYQANDTGDMVVEARDLTTGVIYVRTSTASIWSAWGVDNVSQFVKKSGDVMTGLLTLSGGPTSDLHAATKKYVDDLPPVYISQTPPPGVEPGTLWWESDTGLLYVLYDDGTSIQWVIASPQPDIATFVQKAGDTMTGNLTISKPTPSIVLQKAASGEEAAIYGRLADLSRWKVIFGTTAAESGSNAGSNFQIVRYNDAGAIIATPFSIDRATGLITIEADPTAALAVATKQYVDARAAPPSATAAEYIANNAPTKLLTPGSVWTAAGTNPTVTDLATTILDFSAGINFYWGINASGRTLGSPANQKSGQSGIIRLGIQSAGASVTGWAADWKFPGGVKPTTTVTVGAIDVMNYYVAAPGTIYCSFMGDCK